jgi:hypothetical protein
MQVLITFLLIWNAFGKVLPAPPLILKAPLESKKNIGTSTSKMSILMYRTIEAHANLNPRLFGDRKLEKHSLESFQEARQQFEAVLKDARALMPTLKDTEVIECQNLIDVIVGELASSLSDAAYYLPCRSRQPCVVRSLFSVLSGSGAGSTSVPLPSSQDLSDFGDGVRDIQEAFAKGVEAGITLPKRDAESLYGMLKAMPTILPKSLGNATIAGILGPVNELADYMIANYMSKVKESPRVSLLPNSTSIYQGLILHHTSTNISAQGLHDLGLSEVARIEKLMDATKAKIGYNGTLQNFQKDLNDETKYPELFAKSENEYFEKYRETIADTYKLIPKFFTDIPKQPLEVESADQGSAFYSNGVFYINIGLVRNTPMHDRVALSLHEGVPGHHLDLALQSERRPRLHEFYNYYFQTSYTEGWGLYAEYLGEEMGAYTSDILYFGRLELEMLRAVRLVVDTGMHALDWTEQKAIDYLLSKVSYKEAEAREQIERYADWPGQALAYKVGELNFIKLRKKAEAQLGPAFDIKKFHKLILDNSNISVRAVELLVERWIANGGNAAKGISLFATYLFFGLTMISFLL